jgi:hypothetical protein
MDDIESTIHAYFGDLEGDKHHRYRSWEHCYRFFQETGRERLAEHRHQAALQLGFYLASWGMYRGGSFLLQRAYTAHLPAVDCLADPRWSQLWEREFGSSESDDSLIDVIVDLRACLGAAYICERDQQRKPTDTLATKILLGTLGCSPAVDRYFVIGFRGEGHRYSYFNRPFVGRMLEFSRTLCHALRRAQSESERSVGFRYPLMKLIDMHFYQTGWVLDAKQKEAEAAKR